MQTGVITPDNLAQILRELSQKRKSGMLEINCVDYMIYLHFVHGKIMEVVDTRQHAANEVFERLQKAGYVSSDLEGNFGGESQPYKALMLELNEHPEDCVVDEELFSLAIKHRILDKLYGLDLGSGAYYNFKMQMPSGEKDFLPSLPVGTLLLDLVALESDASRFAELFPADKYVVRNSDGAESSDIEESILLELLAEPVAIAELSERCILSKFFIQDFLLAAYEKGEVLVVDAEAGAESAAEEAEPTVDQEEELRSDQEEDPMVSDLVSALEASIDESFSEAASEIEALSSAVSEVFPDAEPVAEKKSKKPSQEIDQDEEFEDDDDEYEYVDEDWQEANLGAHMSVTSMKLLHSDWVPAAVGLVFAAMALLLPFFTWRQVLAVFSGY